MNCYQTVSDLPRLLSRTSAPDYLLQVSETAIRIQTAADPTEAVELLEEAAARLGADAAAFVSSVDDANGNTALRYLVACDPSWLDEYERKAMTGEDPWLGYAATHSEPIRVSELGGGKAQERPLGLSEERFGFRSAVIVPIANAQFARFGALYIGSNTLGYFESGGYPTFKIAARVLATQLHEWWLSYLREDLLARSQLTNQEIALLAEERRGKKTKQIARDLGVSPEAIHSRFQRVNAKLHVQRKSAAARMAAEYGLI